MGNLTEDIARLCGEIETLRDSRKVFGSQLDKENTEMKSGVSRMRAGFRKDQNNMAVRTKADRVKFVSSLDAEVRGFLNAFDKTHAEMAANTKRENVQFVSGVANHVAGLLTGYKKDRKAMGQATKRENTIFVADITRFVNTKNKETKVLMDGFKIEHKKMAKVTKADRTKFLNKLEDNVAAMRKDNVNDLVGARAALASLSPQGRKARLMAEQRAKAEQERKLRMEAEQKGKALEEARARADAERSKAQEQSLPGMKKDKR